MNSRHCHLSCRKQAIDGGVTVKICNHSSACIVGGGNNRDRLSCDVQFVSFPACLIDVRESLFQLRGGQVSEIEPHKVFSPSLQFGIDCTGNDISGGQREPLVVAVHELLPVLRLQDGTETADGLGNQERGASRIVEGRRVELDELHVCNARSRSVGHGNAVAGGNNRIGRVEIDLTQSAGTEHDNIGEEHLHPMLRNTQDIRTPAMDGSPGLSSSVCNVVFGDQIDCNMVLEHSDSRVFRHRIEQRPLNFSTREVLCVDDPIC